MKRIYKLLSMFMVIIITIVTASGCGTPTGPNSEKPSINISTTPSVMTFRYMTEELYLGYLGAQRDFILLVDNSTYTTANEVQGCGEGKSAGCASFLAKTVIGYGVKAVNFNGVDGSENVLIYYAPSGEFDNYGAGNDGWYAFLTGRGRAANMGQGYSEFIDDDYVLEASCGTNASKSTNVCKYSRELTNQGYSSSIGNAMLILYHNGVISTIISDKMLDPIGSVNSDIDNRFDELDMGRVTYQTTKNYYDSLISVLQKRIVVSTATHSKATSAGEKINIQDIESLSELRSLTNGSKGVKNYLLLITSSGFVEEKVGNNYYYNTNNEVVNDNIYGEPSTEEEAEWQKTTTVLLNSVSTYVDNCALADNELANFLKDMLASLISGAIGAGIGALVGTAIFPGIGTAIGAFIGFFAGLFLNNKVKAELKAHNGIMDTNYCNIMLGALDNIDSNVPVYRYNIGSSRDNVTKYNTDKSSMDPILKDYYDNNKATCLGQHVGINVPSSLLSFLTPTFNEGFIYADGCEKRIVQSYTGIFGGSPSLLLYLDGKKVDDLYGRVTANLVAEMMVTWGLQSVGDVYTLASTGKYNDMSFTIGSAQEISNAYYCYSESSMPDCSGLATIPIALGNYPNYIGAADVSKGITIPVLSKYIERSHAKSLTDISIDPSMYNIKFGRSEMYNTIYYYKHVAIENTPWLYETIAVEPDIVEAELKGEIMASITTGRDTMYQVTFNGVNYIIFDDGDVVGYTNNAGSNVKTVVYYYSHVSNSEYIFNGDTGNNGANENNYFTRANKEDASIDATYPFYVHVKYQVGVGDDAESAAYTYIV